MRVTATVVGNTLVVDSGVEFPEGARVEAELRQVDGCATVAVDALSDAISKRDFESVLRAFSVYRPREGPGSTYSPLEAAVNHWDDTGDLSPLAILLRMGVPVDETDGSGRETALLMAVFREAKAAVAMLLACGANPNVRGAEGDTPLSHAIETGQLETARLLLLCGGQASIDERASLADCTALEAAVARLNVDAVELLLSFGARKQVHHRDAASFLPPNVEPEQQQRRDRVHALLAVGSSNRT